MQRSQSIMTSHPKTVTAIPTMFMYIPPYYTESPEALWARYSPDPEIRAERRKIDVQSGLCHKILDHAKRGDTEAIYKVFETSEVDLATVYARFRFQAWLDMGGLFVAKNVTIFQAALHQPEEYVKIHSDQIDGKHTGQSFATLLEILDQCKIEKTVLLNQDQAGRTVLHTAVLTHKQEQTAKIEQLLLEVLDNEPEIKDELWGIRDKLGKTYEDYLHPKGCKSIAASTLAPPSADCFTVWSGIKSFLLGRKKN